MSVTYQTTPATQAQSNIQAVFPSSNDVTIDSKLQKNNKKPHKNIFLNRQRLEEEYMTKRYRDRTKFHLECIFHERIAQMGRSVKLLRSTLIADLEKYFGEKISTRTYSRCINEMIEAGKIIVKRGKKNGDKWTSSIFILIDVNPIIYEFKSLNCYMGQQLAHRKTNLSKKKDNTTSMTDSISAKASFKEKKKMYQIERIAKKFQSSSKRIVEKDQVYPNGDKVAAAMKELGLTATQKFDRIEEFQEYCKVVPPTSIDEGYPIKQEQWRWNGVFINWVKKAQDLRQYYGDKYIRAAQRYEFNNKCYQYSQGKKLAAIEKKFSKSAKPLINKEKDSIHDLNPTDVSGRPNEHERTVMNGLRTYGWLTGDRLISPQEAALVPDSRILYMARKIIIAEKLKDQSNN